jgi:AcrR family transcriptional regulator
MMQKKYQENDLRVKRTQKLVLDALIELTIQKGFSTVTVSDIASLAGINRATFYRHYKDKFDLVNQYTENIYEMLSIRSDAVSELKVHQMPPNLVKIFEHIKENAKFYRVMLGRHGYPAFAEKIRNFIQMRIKSSLPVNLQKDEKLLDLFVNYSSSASFGAVLWWLEHDMPYSSEEMPNIIRQLESKNLHAIFG